MTTARVWIVGLTLLCINGLAQTWQPERIIGLEYPKSALIRAQEGSVEIECYIANDGSVVRAEPMSGEAELASAAIRNAMHWRFRRISPGNDKHRLVYHFRIKAVPKASDLPRFRFVMPGQVFVTAEKTGVDP